jgi:hypothetical protein
MFDLDGTDNELRKKGKKVPQCPFRVERGLIPVSSQLSTSCSVDQKKRYRSTCCCSFCHADYQRKKVKKENTHEYAKC